jgi:hypothetical protein
MYNVRHHFTTQRSGTAYFTDFSLHYSIPDVIGFFKGPNPYSSTLALGVDLACNRN